MRGESGISMNRRDWLKRSSIVCAAVALAPIARLVAQDNGQPGTTRANAGVVNMDGDYYKQVKRDPKPNPVRHLDDKQIEELERTLACPCPCTLDVFTCRTTDFTCGNSPAVHRDIQALVEGGYTGDEIMKAMLGTYGEFILMAPSKKGFNLIAWFAPFAALGAGAIALSVVLKRWQRNGAAATVRADAVAGARAQEFGASAEELERLNAALRDDRR